MKEKFIIEVFYTNINLHSAGTEKFIKEQIAVLNKNDIDAILLFPVRKTIPLININMWGLMLNDSLIDIYTTSQIISLFDLWSAQGKQLCGVFIHHLMNLELEGLKQVLLSVKGCQTIIYLHDFYTACIQYNLLKDDNEYCGSALINTQKCAQCIYYPSSVYHHENIIRFFNEINKQNLCFVAPSEYVADLWSKAFPQFNSKLIVIRHQNCNGQYTENMEVIKGEEPLRIAFIGAQSTNKGWNYWKQAIERLNHDQYNYSFYHLGHSTYNSPYIQNVEVSVQKYGPDAMIKALRQNKIHVAVLNSICPETYSYTYFECLASNSFVITNANSGNIATQTSIHGNGIIVDTPNKVLDALSNEKELRIKVNAFRKVKHFGPEYLENNLKFLEFINSGNVAWFCNQSHDQSKKHISHLCAVFLYNIRYRHLGQYFNYRSKKNSRENLEV